MEETARINKSADNMMQISWRDFLDIKYFLFFFLLKQGPEIGTSFIDWIHGECASNIRAVSESGLRTVVLNKNRAKYFQIFNKTIIADVR